jgi:hypothetical protein
LEDLRNNGRILLCNIHITGHLTSLLLEKLMMTNIWQTDFINNISREKCKAFPVTGLQGCETFSRHFVDNWLIDGGEVVSLMHWQCISYTVQLIRYCKQNKNVNSLLLVGKKGVTDMDWKWHLFYAYSFLNK